MKRDDSGEHAALARFFCAENVAMRTSVNYSHVANLTGFNA